MWLVDWVRYRLFLVACWLGLAIEDDEEDPWMP